MASLFARSAATPQPIAAPAARGGDKDAGQPMQPRVHRMKMPVADFGVCATRKVLKEHMGELQPGEIYPYMTGGKWSNHHLLQYMLEKTGPADVYATTWTITEAPVRTMQQLLDGGQMRSLTLLTDHRIKSRAPGAWQLMQTLPATVYLSKCHAKVTVVIGDVHALVAVNSQNMTSNPRIEAGVVLFDRRTAEFYRDAILSEVQQPELAKPPTRRP